MTNHVPLSDLGALRIGYIGNFGAPHSTENHVAMALEQLGHHVDRLQENRPEIWHSLELGPRGEYDLVLWTRTGWDPPVSKLLQLDVIGKLATDGVPLVGFHLDRWWGLDREYQIEEEPFFSVDLLATADGGHDEQWAAAGVEHWWAPPGVAGHEATIGRSRRRLQSRVAFVGSWSSYHKEWTHRLELVEHLRSTWKGQCVFWPKPGRPAVRGAELQDLYASVHVLVGDSCLLGDEPGTYASRYWSDRIPETLGRGGFLIHPFVEGLNEQYTVGEHLVCYPVGDFEALDGLITHYLANPVEAKRIALAGRAHVLERHTYTVRMRELLAEVERRGLFA